jgi:hypothetical protein
MSNYPVGTRVKIAIRSLLKDRIGTFLDTKSPISSSSTAHTYEFTVEDGWLHRLSRLHDIVLCDMGVRPLGLLLGVEAFMQVTNALGQVGARFNFRGSFVELNPHQPPRSMCALPDPEYAASPLNWSQYRVGF